MTARVGVNGASINADGTLKGAAVQAALAALLAPYQQAAGLVVPWTGPWGGNPAAVVATRAYVVRFVPFQSITIAKIAFLLAVAAGSNDNCDVGIFNSALTTLLGSAGSTAGKLNGAVGPTSVNLLVGVPLVAGTAYYAAFACNAIGTTAASLVMSACGSSAAQGAEGLLGTGAGAALGGVQVPAFPLAAPFTFSTTTAAAVPVLGLLA